MGTLLFLKPNQRMFIEPLDLFPDYNFANTRIYELLADHCKFVDNEILTAKTGRKGHTKEHNFFEVTFVSQESLAKAYKHQQDGTLRIQLWVRQGQGPYMRYVPPGKQSL